MNVTACPKFQQSFSKAASVYDRFSSLQKDLGTVLLKAVRGSTYPVVLDVGMGTGWLTEKFSKKFSKSKIIGLDYAFGMAAQAKRRKCFSVLQADAQALPFQNEKFNLIVSNCAYQWVEDITKAFAENARVLKPDGEFYFTCFGSSTLKELREAVRQNSQGKKGELHHWHLLEKNRIRQALADAGFKKIEISSQECQEKFKDLFDLLSWLKSIGANRTKRNVFIGPQFLARAKNYYDKHFSCDQGVRATFDIIFGVAKK